jgi:ABC-type transport system involved in multi-copper enzyme maturation permease subunit
MTTLTLPARLERDARLRPVPWRRMGWVIWRHHRVALAGVAAFLGALAVWLWITGLSVHHEFSAAVACRPVGSANCINLAIIFDSTNTFLKGGFVLQPVPALIGAFIGPLVLAREFETGTFRYAWTQAFGRWRWAVAKLVALGVVVAAIAGAFSILLSWYYQPYVAAQSAPNVAGASPLSAGLFDLRGVAFAAWTLVAFAIGALAGMLIRRIVPAIVATLAAYAALALLTANVLRQHYMAPLIARNLHIPGSAWVIGEWWTKGGSFVFGSRIPLGILPQLCPGTFTASGQGGVISSGGPSSPTQCLLQHGYTEWAKYQPVSHFWPFQWIEGGWLLALSALLATVTVLLVRRRAA